MVLDDRTAEMNGRNEEQKKTLNPTHINARICVLRRFRNAHTLFFFDPHPSFRRGFNATDDSVRNCIHVYVI